MSDKDKNRLIGRPRVAPESITEESELGSFTNMAADSDETPRKVEWPLANGKPNKPNFKKRGSTMNFGTVAKLAYKADEKSDKIRMITKVKKMATKWQHYRNERRQNMQKSSNSLAKALLGHQGGMTPRATLTGEDDEDEPQLSGIGLDEIHADYTTPHSQVVRRRSTSTLDVSMIIDSNRTLISYFSKMAKEPADRAKINLSFVESMLESGGDINCSDKLGQTLLHEACRAWHVDVARWLLERGIEVNQADTYGRTALHVAAAVDCPEMVALLLDFGAEKEAETTGEKQTPVFYAAKSDATNSLKVLIKRECKYKLVRDFKGRTPIHVAAELDRSETARLLLELNAPIGVSDNQGQKAITWMITKMAPVANEALKQFRSVDRHNRKQYFYLNLLVQDRKLDPQGKSQTPLGVGVSYRQFDLLMHPTMRRLLDIMWRKVARFWAVVNLMINFIYILVWTLIGILVEYDERHKYSFPEDWFRIMLWTIAVSATLYQIVDELKEFRRSNRTHNQWEKWRKTNIEDDMKYTHPRWPEEADYLNQELENLKDLGPKYFKDMWNLFDWACYILLLIDVGTHVADVIVHSETLARVHIRFMAVTILLLWLRLMKNARAFALLGPFIVMLGHMMKDCARFLFLYMEFYLPFMAVFWMIYGGTKKSQTDSSEVIVSGFQFPGQVIFSLFRLTLVDDYDYDSMRSIDHVFTDIILIAWFFLSSILCLNLFIALLSDTFQRVYDNAQANSVMEKASTILSIWDGVSPARKDRFFKYIEEHCSPLCEYYDDDLTVDDGEDDLKKVTFQIKDSLDEFTEHFQAHFGESPTSLLQTGGSSSVGGSRGGKKSVVTSEVLEREVGPLQMALDEIKTTQDHFAIQYRQDMDALKEMMRMAVRAPSPLPQKLTSLLPALPPQERATTTTASVDLPESRGADSVETPVTKLRKKKKRRANPMDMVLSVEMLEPSAPEVPQFASPRPNDSPQALRGAFSSPGPVGGLSPDSLSLTADLSQQTVDENISQC